MKVVNTGNTYKIYDSSMLTFDELPAQCYTVRFDKMAGFFLETYPTIRVSEKVYGVHTGKVDKVMGSFKGFNRNLGVILSGAKGIGKSLCAKMLAQKAVEEGYPVIVVNSYIPGIADYISSIDQEVAVLFDEFDKTFSSSSRDEMSDPQSAMLTLFDGLSQGKKLFIITCNDLHNLNSYLVNRPGRFHYHFRFGYPTDDEIREYLEDNIDAAYYGEINKVVGFSRKVDLNYDCLRAIAFELSNGLQFEDAIKDLNIVNLSAESYSVTAFFKDGSKSRERFSMLDLFDDDDISVELEDTEGFNFKVIFNPCYSVYDVTRKVTIVSGDNTEIDWEDWYYSDTPEDEAKLSTRKTRELDYLVIRRRVAKDIHYKI